MKAGGGSAKGAAFERLICRRLSQWVSAGRRDDLFARNVLSGGQHTLAARRGQSRGQPGDITGIDPEAAALLNVLVVECKHRASIGLMAHLLAFDGASTWLGHVIAHTARSAAPTGRQWCIVARENRRPIMLLLPATLYRAVVVASRAAPKMHILHHHCETPPQSLVMLFEAFLDAVDPALFIAAVQEINDDDRPGFPRL